MRVGLRLESRLVVAGCGVLWPAPLPCWPSHTSHASLATPAQGTRRGCGDAGPVHAAHQAAHGCGGVCDARGLQGLRAGGMLAGCCLKAQRWVLLGELDGCVVMAGISEAADKLTCLPVALSPCRRQRTYTPLPPSSFSLPTTWASCTAPAGPWCAAATAPENSSSRQAGRRVAQGWAGLGHQPQLPAPPA